MFDSDTHHIEDFWEDPKKWQFIAHEHIVPGRIAKYFSVRVTDFHINKKLLKEISDTHKLNDLEI